MSRSRAVAQAPQALGDVLDRLPVVLVGHPFAPIGMGAQLRSHLSACRAVGVDATVLDALRYGKRDDPHYAGLIGNSERRSLPGGVRIFHINGDEVDPVVAALEARGDVFGAGYNVIVPAWELPSYPAAWARKLRRFDEVWALSDFIRSSLATRGIRSHLVGQAVEPAPGLMAPRRAFGLRESALVLLCMFDLSSYETRKNPQACIELYRRVVRARPWLDIQLVLKAKRGEAPADVVGGLDEDGRIRWITEPLDSMEVQALVNACDLFVSLHRAEGFGRGLGEAMGLGRVAMGTAWSGNLDFMTPSNSLLVRCTQTPVQPGAYPHGRGQSWAEPDMDHAADLLLKAIDTPGRLQALGRRGRSDVLRTHGNRAVGLRILDRLEQIATVVTLDAVTSDQTHRPEKHTS